MSTRRRFPVIAVAAAIFTALIAPQGSTSVAHATTDHLRVQGEIVQLQVATEGDTPWWETTELGHFEAGWSGRLLNGAQDAADTDCQQRGYDGADLTEVDQALRFPQRWQGDLDAGFMGPVQAELDVVYTCR